MKTYIKHFLLAAALASGVAQGAATATTIPVGYTTVTVPAATDTVIAVPLQNSIKWAGVSTGISNNQISVAADSFAANEFVYVPVTQPKTYMAQVTSGPLIGRYFLITANGTSNLTVDPVGSNTLQSQGFVTGNTFQIRPYWTLNTLFPNGAPLGASNFDAVGNQVLITVNSPGTPTGVNRSSTNQYYYDDGTGPFFATPQWSNQTFAASNDVIIDPANGVTIRNSSASPLSIVIPGTVESVPTGTLVISDVVTNDTVIQLPYPVNTTLGLAGFITSGAVAPTTDWTEPKDQVLVYNPLATGVNPAPEKVYNYITDPQFTIDIGGAVPGWYDSSFAPSDNAILPSNGGIVVRKVPTEAYQAQTWKATLPYTP